MTSQSVSEPGASDLAMVRQALAIAGNDGALLSNSRFDLPPFA